MAVEPSSNLNKKFSESISLNQGHLERVTLIRAFLGSPNDYIINAVKDDPYYIGATWIKEEDLIEIVKLTRIDFLKCDIEGGEFGLFTLDSRLISLTKSLAIEVHSFAGNVQEFIENIEKCGFEILEKQLASDGSCTLLATKN